MTLKMSKGQVMTNKNKNPVSKGIVSVIFSDLKVSASALTEELLQ